MKSIITIIVSVVLPSCMLWYGAEGFNVVSLKRNYQIKSMTSSSSSSSLLIRFADSTPKGFGDKPTKKEKSTGQQKRDTESNKYDEIASVGGQEYNIFVRQFGGNDKSWLPCGKVAVPRGSQVSDAIYANVIELEKAIVRTYVKLGGYEKEFEYGYNLKIYPDDPIEVAKKGTPKKAGISVGNWISTLLSPIDASQVKRPNP